MKAKAVFLDRDGVLNIDIAYLYKVSDLRWIDGAKEALSYLCQQGYMLFVVTNQSGIARGYYTVEDMNALHNHMQAELKQCGANIEKFYYCPHHPKGALPEYTMECSCRKPQPGMILRAFDEYDLDKEQSFLIGDKDSDIEAAKRSGIAGYKFTGGNLLEFVKNIVKG